VTTRQEPVVGEFDQRRDLSTPEAVLLASSAPFVNSISQTNSSNQNSAHASIPPLPRSSEAGARSLETGESSPSSARRRTTVRAKSRRGGREKPGEDSRNRWLVSYADFVTLLLGLFVVMYAISSINEEKYQKLSKTFAGIFENSSLTMDPLQIGEPVAPVTSEVVEAATDVPREQPADAKSSALLTSREHVASALGGITKNKGLNVASNERWLEISLDAEISFESDSARLKPAAVEYLRDIVDWLGTFENPVTIEGFTDNVPVNGGRFASNWQLSAARASAVAENLTLAGIDAERISAVGYGENHPLATNASPEGRAKNRRVVIVVAHDGKEPRNLNSSPETSAFAFVRRDDDEVFDVPPRRTAQGGLLFSNE
jgi:chemotaxis protein MotB